jgi:hypothetical protein
LSLVQVYFRERGDLGDGDARAEETLKRFLVEEPGEEQLATAGDPIMLEPVYREVTAQDLERLFGTDFAAAVLPLPEDAWSGPVRSGYGLHLVKILSRTPARLPQLDEVKERVLEDLTYENRKASEEQGFQEVAGKYRVTITPKAERLLEGSGSTP